MSPLSLVVFAFAAIAGSVVDSMPPDTLPSESIHVVSNSHQINFPTEVVLQLQVEAPAEITEVTLFYRLGHENTTTYGYPRFVPGTRVSADFRIATGGASYVPTGADIEYYYVIRDAEGHAFKTETYSLMYTDPRFEWQELQLGDLVYLWHDRPVERVQEVAAEVTRRLESVKAVLGLSTIRPMKAVVLNSRSEARRSFPLVSEAASLGHFYGGFAFGDLDLFLLAGLDPEGIIHEMTHLLLDEAIDSPLARVPAWLNEGLAMYFESDSRSRQLTVTRAARSGDLMPLRRMGRVPGRSRDIGLFYAQSWSVVNHMMDAHGRDRMAALLSALNEGRGLEDAVLDAYGMSLEELESEWMAGLSGAERSSPAPNTGFAATSFIVGGAVAMAVVAIVVRWLRHLAGPTNAGDAQP